MNYEHENSEVFGENHFYCKHCGKSELTVSGPALPEGICPERIVQEVVRRLAVELKKVDVVPAKRRHHQR